MRAMLLDGGGVEGAQATLFVWGGVTMPHNYGMRDNMPAGISYGTAGCSDFRGFRGGSMAKR